MEVGWEGVYTPEGVPTTVVPVLLLVLLLMSVLLVEEEWVGVGVAVDWGIIMLLLVITCLFLSIALFIVLHSPNTHGTTHC